MTPCGQPRAYHFSLAQRAGKLAADTDASRPGRSCTSAPGLADQKDTDRLMDMMTARAQRGKP